MYKQDIAFKKYAKYTIEELLTIFTAEALYISKKPEVVCSIAESALNKSRVSHLARLSENDFGCFELKKKLPKTPLESTFSPSGRVWLSPESS